MTDLTNLSDAELQSLYRQTAGGAAPGTKMSYSAPLWDAAEAVAAEKTGVPAEVMRTIRTVGERSNGDQVSPKGARGVYQFIPSSRDAFLKKYGVDAYSEDPEEQALATLRKATTAPARGTRPWPASTAASRPRRAPTPPPRTATTPHARAPRSRVVRAERRREDS